jgi:predicted TIM-barrel fold metal-dependent hydrolase
VSGIPIFDALAHPTLDGRWIRAHDDASFETLQQQMASSSVKWACAIGMDGIGGYSHESFFAECQKYDNLFPVAGFNPLEGNIDKTLERLKKIGFYGIKIHPRYSKAALTDERMDRTLKACARIGLPVFLCTFFYEKSLNMIENNFLNLVKLVNNNVDTRIVLVHGGAVEVMKYMELVRFNTNLLLDLSMTMIKYEGSSLDLDIQYLFNYFDRRICIGTDHPEYSPEELEKRFVYFSRGISDEKRRNIAYLNISKFLGITLQSGH